MVNPQSEPDMPSSFVSVIIPVFNDAGGIQKCLDALERQSVPMNSFEVIVVDNGSSPPLRLTQARPYSLRVEQCLTPGSYAARNAGAATARGDTLAFTDADCVPCPNWLREGVTGLTHGGQRCVIGGDVRIDLPEKRSGVGLYQYVTGFQQRENVQNKGYAATANLFCLKDTFDTIGPFDERLLSGGDRDWCWRALQRDFKLAFNADAWVSTGARTSLRSAVRQARRVTAGRKHLLQHGLARQGMSSIKPHRSIGESLAYIATNPALTPIERLRVLIAASLLKGVAWLESIRLALGGKAERR